MDVSYIPKRVESSQSISDIKESSYTYEDQLETIFFDKNLALLDDFTHKFAS